ncbi:MAG TPA: response regulator [Pyrinomonadaceae bacterium]|jgi:CheY-like chemotaxis protein|nr:response regulator [Pyrinomonadaceae bacterium]
MRYTILIVEDTKDTRELFRLMLQVRGYQVLEADNGLVAVEVARRDHPDAILMDMSLPVLDGCQATRRIREQPEMRAIPIIACTAHNQWEWRGKAILAGCTDFMTKPFDADALNSMLSRHLPA